MVLDGVTDAPLSVFDSLELFYEIVETQVGIKNEGAVGIIVGTWWGVYRGGGDVFGSLDDGAQLCNRV